MNGLSLPESNQIPSFIESLCDLIPNKKRRLQDFYSLRLCLDRHPKECAPFKKKILQHLQIHALENPRANLKLLSKCFAKATLLFRKTPNKDEGPLGAWKSGLASELLNLEENINLLYEIVNVHSSRIITKGSIVEEEEALKHKEKLRHESGFESVIDEYALKIEVSAHNICALISVQTDFDLPIPIVVILRLAAKVGLLRWKDYKKNFVNLVRTHVYSLSPRLIEINLFLFKTAITVMGTNIIPFCPFINQTLSRALEWTRASNLAKFSENLYYSMRANLFDVFLFTAKQLSLNINLEPSILNSLIEVELVESLENITTRLGDEKTTYQEKYIIGALTLLDELIIIYSSLLPASLEYKTKNYVVQLCIRIYREFQPDIMSLPCRKQLLKLLQTIANQPYATSTTEISHHIFELVMKVESESELIQSTRRSLKVGFSHRPVIVSHLDGHDYQFHFTHMLNGKESGRESKEDEEVVVNIEESTVNIEEAVINTNGNVVDTDGAVVNTSEAVVNPVKPVESPRSVVPRDDDDDDAETDEKVLSMLDSFVNKLA